MTGGIPVYIEGWIGWRILATMRTVPLGMALLGSLQSNPNRLFVRQPIHIYRQECSHDAGAIRYLLNALIRVQTLAKLLQRVRRATVGIVEEGSQ